MLPRRFGMLMTWTGSILYFNRRRVLFLPSSGVIHGICCHDISDLLGCCPVCFHNVRADVWMELVDYLNQFALAVSFRMAILLSATVMLAMAL